MKKFKVAFQWLFGKKTMNLSDFIPFIIVFFIILILPKDPISLYFLYIILLVIGMRLIAQVLEKFLREKNYVVSQKIFIYGLITITILTIVVDIIL